MLCRGCESKEVAEGSSLGNTSKNNQSWDVSQQPSTERSTVAAWCGARDLGALAKRLLGKYRDTQATDSR